MIHAGLGMKSFEVRTTDQCQNQSIGGGNGLEFFLTLLMVMTPLFSILRRRVSQLCQNQKGTMTRSLVNAVKFFKRKVCKSLSKHKSV